MQDGQDGPDISIRKACTVDEVEGVLMTRRYKGKLFYTGSNDYLDITALIIRPDEIGFSLASVSELGRWEAESGKVALLQPDGSYLAKGVKASQQRTAASNPWDIVFRIEHEVPGEAVEISGELWDVGECPFEGELDAY